MPSVIEIIAIGTAVLYLLPTRLITRIRPGFIRRVLYIGPFTNDQYEVEIALTNQSNRLIPPTHHRTFHPVRPTTQRRPRRNRHRNRRNNRRQEEADVENLVVPPAPPYQAQDPSIVSQAPSPAPVPSSPSSREPSIEILETPPAFFRRTCKPTPYPTTLIPIRVSRPNLPILPSNHIDTRLAIRSGPPITSVLTAWVVNRDFQRVERYFQQDRHLDGASYLEFISLSEVDESGDWAAKLAVRNYIKHTQLIKEEAILSRRIYQFQLYTFQDLTDPARALHTEYTTAYIDLGYLRLEIQRLADSVRFLPGTHRFVHYPGFETLLQRAQQFAREGGEVVQSSTDTGN